MNGCIVDEYEICSVRSSSFDLNETMRARGNEGTCVRMNQITNKYASLSHFFCCDNVNYSTMVTC